MQNDLLYIGIFMLVSLFIPAVAIAIAGVLGPKKPAPIKNSTYECGIETIGETWVQFRAQYYVYALIFLVFDVETIFLYPWAVAYQLQTIWAVFEMVLFVLILLSGIIFAWRKGALDWQ